MPIYHFPDRIHGNPKNELESELTKFLKNIAKNPKENYLAAAIISMSSLDLEMEMKNPESSLRKTIEAAYEEAAFQELYNTVILPAMVLKEMELRALFDEMMLSTGRRDRGLPAVEMVDFRGLTAPERAKLETALNLFKELEELQKELGELKMERQNIIVDGYAQKVNFLKSEMQRTAEDISTKLATLPKDHPDRAKLEVSLKQVQEIVGNLEIASKKVNAFKNSGVYSPEETAKLGQELESVINSAHIPTVLDNAYGKDSVEHKERIKKGLDGIDRALNSNLMLINSKIIETENKRNEKAIKFDKCISENPKLEGHIKGFDDKKKQELKNILEGKRDEPRPNYQAG